MAEDCNGLTRRLKLGNVPLGHVLNPQLEPSPEETVAFTDWICPLNAPPNWRHASFWRITTEDSDHRRILEYWMKGDQALVTGSLNWRDGRIEADIRQLIGSSASNPDDEDATIARCGVMARMWTVRHYYLLCLEGLNRVVLYRRENNSYTELAGQEMRIDPNRYYHLHLHVRGNRIRAYCNNQKIGDVFDSAHRHGLVGIRTNSLSRFEHLTATLSPEEVNTLSISRQRQAEYLEEIQARYPKPILHQEINIPGNITAIGQFGSGDKHDLLFNTITAKGRTSLTATTLNGKEIWTRETNGQINMIRTADMNGKALHTIAGVADNNFVVISGNDGVEKARRPYPETSVFHLKPGQTAAIDSLYIAHLRCGDNPCDIVTKECDPGGGHAIWCFDEELNLRWQTTIDQPRHGHHISFYDFDGDGREEVCAGYHLLGPDGEVRWRIEGGQSFEVFAFGRHADSCVGGDFNQDGRGEIAIVGGGEGFMLCDAETGELIAKHPIGHAQGLSTASFRKDLPGMEIHVGTRWGNYGIRAFYGGDGSHLMTFQPDFVGQQGTPVNWTGDGEELLFLGSSPQVYGLWNAYGQKLGLLPERQGQIIFADVVEDPRDEILIFADGALSIFTQDRPAPNPNRVYAPIRHRKLASPVASYPSIFANRNWFVPEYYADHI